MHDEFQTNQERIILLRKKLVAIEARRARYEHDVPSEIWQDLVRTSHELEQAEQNMREMCQQLAEDVNRTRDAIVSTLAQYNHWREQMRQIELLFLVNIIRPGQYLKQAIQQRENLEREHERIHKRIQFEGYASLQELEADIRHVLVAIEPIIDPEFDQLDDEPIKEDISPKILTELGVDDLVEVISKEELIKKFKRVVLPKVHPDTSDTSPEIFKTVYDVYKNRDYLLMEAYVVEYDGEIQPEEDADPLESMDQVIKIQKNYRRLSTRLNRRIERLKQELTSQEVEDPGKIQEDFRRQRQEIIAQIRVEAEKILYWREKIEALVQVYRDSHGQSGDEE